MTACPSWCGKQCATSDIHRGVIGRTTVGGETVAVTISQVSDGWPSVMLSGPVVMEINDLDHEDMAKLLTLSGQPALAELVRRAARVLRAAQAQRAAEDAAPAGKAG